MVEQLVVGVRRFVLEAGQTGLDFLDRRALQRHLGARLLGNRVVLHGHRTVHRLRAIAWNFEQTIRR